MDAFTSLVSRVFFVGAFGLLAVSSLEALVNLSGYTILRGTYSAGRLLEFAVVLLFFVLAIVLRQVRDELRRRGA